MSEKGANMKVIKKPWPDWDILWPEVNKPEITPAICKHTGKPFWPISRYRLLNPNLMFWIDDSNVNIKFTEDSSLLADGEVTVIDGNFFRSAGNPWFKPKVYKPKHRLIRVAWGGPNNPTRGCEYESMIQLEDVIYHIRKTTDSGKSGVNWYVVRSKFSWYDLMTEEQRNDIERKATEE